MIFPLIGNYKTLKAKILIALLVDFFSSLLQGIHKPISKSFLQKKLFLLHLPVP